MERKHLLMFQTKQLGLRNFFLNFFKFNSHKVLHIKHENYSILLAIILVSFLHR